MNQLKVFQLYKERGYTNDLKTLALGLAEEAGEVAKAVNYYHNPEYKPTSGRPVPDTVEHELKDCLIYICGIANVLGIDLQLGEE